MDDIAVSVCCITYNHEKFIKDTLEGILSQKTNFAFEVLIHDDASTDETQKIISEYAEKYPEIIKPILQKENHRSKGISVQRTFNYPRTKGKYVAFCDGDDFWSDPLKLQMQFDALERHSDCALCVHNTRYIDEIGEKKEACFPGTKLPAGTISADRYIHLELGEGYWLFQTSSYFVRKEVVDDFREYQHEYPCGDLPLVLFALQYGDCWYIPREMSFYRQHGGSVMATNAKSLDTNIKYVQRMIAGHKKFNELTKWKYGEDVDCAIRLKEAQILYYQGSYRKLFTRRYRTAFTKLTLNAKLLTCFGAVFPKIAHRVYCASRK